MHGQRSQNPRRLGNARQPGKKSKRNAEQKRVTPEDGLAAALEELARDIALIEPDPRDWGEWIIYLLELLQAEARRRGKRADFDDVLDFFGKSAE